MCCQTADDETLEHEIDAFDCETCPIQQRLTALDVDNRRAWELAHLLWTRLIWDMQGAMPALLRLTPDLDEDGFADLLRRLAIIYDVLVPPPPVRDA